MLYENNKYIAYSCPACLSITTRKLNFFQVSSQKPLHCSNEECNSPIVEFIPKRDRYIIEYECMICGGIHRFSISKDGFWKNEELIISCPETLIDVIIIADEKKTKQFVKDQQESYKNAAKELIADSALNIYFKMLDLVNIMSKDKKVTCSCGGNNVNIELYDGYIDLICRDCSRKKQIKICETTYEELLKTGTIVLE